MLAGIDTPGTAAWWLRRLLAQLVDTQRPQVMRNSKYLKGDHPLPPLDEAVDGLAFRRFLATARSNYIALVVEAVIERMRVVGFRAGTADRVGDDASMKLWRAAHLDADQALVHRSVIGLSQGYVMGGHHPRKAGRVLLTVESPMSCTTIAFPDDPREVEAAAKVWIDPDGRHRAAVYLVGQTFTFTGPEASAVDNLQPLYRTELQSSWTQDGPPTSTGLPMVPVVPFHNRRDADGTVKSEFEDVVDIQNRINATLLHRLVAEKYASFRQKAILNLDLATEEVDDPENEGEKIERAIQPTLPSHPGVTWLLEGEHLGMWESQQTSTADILKGVEADIRDLAAITRTPPHYLLGSIVNASGDALKAAETGLVSKVRERLAQAGESWEAVMRLAHHLSGDDTLAEDDALEVIWADPESRSLAEVYDAAVKAVTAGVPWRSRMELLGKTPAEIDRMEAERAQDAMLAALAAPPAPQQLGPVPSRPATDDEAADAVPAELDEAA